METGAWDRLASGLARCRDVDDVAATTLRGLLEVPGVVRAGLALTVVGGRQLRFLPSDADRMGPPAAWCLIDAFDPLPLNDAVRTGREVVHPTQESFRRVYRELPTRQGGSDVHGLVALPLQDAAERLGGLLVYLDRELTEEGTRRSGLDGRLGALVARALVAVRRDDASWADAATAGFLLPPDATAPAVARRHLRDALAGLQVEADTVDSALVCASELVTNVVMHTGSPSLLSVERTEGALTVRVEQPTPTRESWIAKVQDDDPLRVSGRGLELVDALASDWGSETAAGTTTTWYRLELERDDSRVG